MAKINLFNLQLYPPKDATLIYAGPAPSTLSFFWFFLILSFIALQYCTSPYSHDSSISCNFLHLSVVNSLFSHWIRRYVLSLLIRWVRSNTPRSTLMILMSTGNCWVRFFAGIDFSVTDFESLLTTQQARRSSFGCRETSPEESASVRGQLI